MSADYLNFVVALASPDARRAFDRLAARQRVTDLVGPNEETLFRMSAETTLDLAAVAAAYAGGVPTPGYYGPTYVHVAPDGWLETLERESVRSGCLLSVGEPALSVVDRVLALPRGIAFLEGKAIARFRPKRRARLLGAWARLMSEVGGPAGAAARLAPHMSRGSRLGEVGAVMEEVTRALAWAEGRDCDLLLFATPT